MIKERISQYAVNVDRLKGENSFVSENHIENGEATLCLNMISDRGGVIRSRGGFKPLFAEVPDGLIIDYLRYKKSDGTSQHLILSRDDTQTYFYQWNEGTESWDLKYTFTEMYEGGMYPVLDKVIIGNGVSTSIYWDGTTATPDATIPKGWIFQVYNGRIQVAGNKSNPSNLFYSKPWQASQPDQIEWEGTGYDKGGVIGMNRNDGQPITALGVKNQVLVIEKTKSKYEMTYEEIQTELVPKVIPFRTSFGTVAPRTFDEVENDFISLAHDGYHTMGEAENYQSLRAGLISADIKPSILRINPHQIQNACGRFHDNKYFSAVAVGTNTINTYSPIYDFITKSWFPWAGVLAKFFFVYEDDEGKEFLGYGHQTEKQLYVYDPTQNYDGIESRKIPFKKYWKSKRFDFDIPNIQKYPEKLDIIGYLSEDTELNVHFYRDFTKQTVVLKSNPEGGLIITKLKQEDEESPIFGEGINGQFILGGETTIGGVKMYKFLASVPFHPSAGFLSFQVAFENVMEDQPFQIDSFHLKVLDSTEDDLSTVYKPT